MNHFDSCESVSVALDSSSVGGYDLLLLLVIGQNKAGVVKAAWAPPQD